jgi:hypothetical protein
MLHPIFSTTLQRPDLIVEHASAYGALLAKDAEVMSTQVIKRALACLLTVVCGSVFISLVGMAVMLGFLFNQFHWALVAVPIVALAMTVVSAIFASGPLATSSFTEFKAQVSSDARALRAVS